MSEPFSVSRGEESVSECYYGRRQTMRGDANDASPRKGHLKICIYMEGPDTMTDEKIHMSFFGGRSPSGLVLGGQIECMWKT